MRAGPGRARWIRAGCEGVEGAGDEGARAAGCVCGGEGGAEGEGGGRIQAGYAGAEGLWSYDEFRRRFDEAYAREEAAAEAITPAAAAAATDAARVAAAAAPSAVAAAFDSDGSDARTGDKAGGVGP